MREWKVFMVQCRIGHVITDVHIDGILRAELHRELVISTAPTYRWGAFLRLSSAGLSLLRCFTELS